MSDMSATSHVVVCEGLVKIYETATSRVQAVRGVDLRLPPAAPVAITGPSGSGKSSLLRMISGLSRPTAGRIEVGGVDLTDLRWWQRRGVARRLVAHVEQRPGDNLLPHLTAIDQVRHAAARRGEDTSLAAPMLERLGLADRLDRSLGVIEIDRA